MSPSCHQGLIGRQQSWPRFIHGRRHSGSASASSWRGAARAVFRSGAVRASSGEDGVRDVRAVRCGSFRGVVEIRGSHADSYAVRNPTAHRDVPGRVQRCAASRASSTWRSTKPPVIEEQAASWHQRKPTRCPAAEPRADVRVQITDLAAERRLCRARALLGGVRDAAFLCRAVK